MQERPELPFSRLVDTECWALKSGITQTEQSSLLLLLLDTAPINWQGKWQRKREKGSSRGSRGSERQRGHQWGGGGQEWEQDRGGGGLVGIMGDWECWSRGWCDHKGSRLTPQQMGECEKAVHQSLSGLWEQLFYISRTPEDLVSITALLNLQCSFVLGYLFLWRSFCSLLVTFFHHYPVEI